MNPLKKAFLGLNQEDQDTIFLILDWVNDMGQYMRFWRGSGYNFPEYIECDIPYLKKVWNREYLVYNQLERRLTSFGQYFVKSLTLQSDQERMIDYLFGIMLSELNCDIYLKADILISTSQHYIDILS